MEGKTMGAITLRTTDNEKYKSLKNTDEMLKKCNQAASHWVCFNLSPKMTLEKLKHLKMLHLQ